MTTTGGKTLWEKYFIAIIKRKSQIGKEGVSLLGISDAAEAIGFRTRPLKITYNMFLEGTKSPVALHWKQNHFAKPTGYKI